MLGVFFFLIAIHILVYVMVQHILYRSYGRHISRYSFVQYLLGGIHDESDDGGASDGHPYLYSNILKKFYRKQGNNLKVSSYEIDQHFRHWKSLYLRSTKVWFDSFETYLRDKNVYQVVPPKSKINSSIAAIHLIK